MQPPQKVRRVTTASDEANLSANLSVNLSGNTSSSQTGLLSVQPELTVINGSDKLDKFMKQFKENMDKNFANNCFIQSQTTSFTSHSL